VIFPLTQEQQLAVDFQEGPAFLSASAGAGKTRVLVERYKRLIQSGVSPTKILAITFTNKAAKEIKERALESLPNINEKQMHVFTFHGLCHYWLRKVGELIGKKKFQILPADDADKILSSVVSTLSCVGGVELETAKDKKVKMGYAKKALGILDSVYGLSSSEIAEKISHRSTVRTFVENVLAEYRKLKDKQNKLDFADLQLFGIQLFKNQYFSHEYDFVMVKFVDPSLGN